MTLIVSMITQCNSPWSSPRIKLNKWPLQHDWGNKNTEFSFQKSPLICIKHEFHGFFNNPTEMQLKIWFSDVDKTNGIGWILCLVVMKESKDLVKCQLLEEISELLLVAVIWSNLTLPITLLQNQQKAKYTTIAELQNCDYCFLMCLKYGKYLTLIRIIYMHRKNKCFKINTKMHLMCLFCFWIIIFRKNASFMCFSY